MRDDVLADQTQWSEPVRVRVGYGFPETIRGPEDALNYLKWRWPVREGRYYFEALKACADSLHDRVPVEKVRDTFVLASIEAQMLG